MIRQRMGQVAAGEGGAAPARVEQLLAPEDFRMARSRITQAIAALRSAEADLAEMGLRLRSAQAVLERALDNLDDPFDHLAR